VSRVRQPIESCQIEIRVRYAEVDAMGYLHHARYFVYFEMGRTELLRLNGLRYRDLEARGVFYVVARLECRFRAPARYDDILQLTTTTKRLTPVRVDHAYQLCRGGQLLSEASSTVVCVGRDGRPQPLPDDLYDILTGAAPLPQGDHLGFGRPGTNPL
jgi:acyl-CoA thioester hydrolase